MAGLSVSGLVAQKRTTTAQLPKAGLERTRWAGIAGLKAVAAPAAVPPVASVGKGIASVAGTAETAVAVVVAAAARRSSSVIELAPALGSL